MEKSGAFLGFTVSGLIGGAIAYFGVIFAQQSAATAENQYFMQLDQIRHATYLSESLSFEDKLKELALLQDIKDNGFRVAFEGNLERDIARLEDELARIASAQEESDEAAASERAAAELRAANAAQQLKEEAVRTNPIIFQDCFGGSRPSGPNTNRNIQYQCP